MKLPGMPDVGHVLPLAERAVLALETIATALAIQTRPTELRTKDVLAKCGCSYAAEVDAHGSVIARGTWQRIEVCAHHARERGFMTGDLFRLGGRSVG